MAKVLDIESENYSQGRNIITTYNDWRRNNLHCDTVIDCANEIKFFAHSFVLRATCPHLTLIDLNSQNNSSKIKFKVMDDLIAKDCEKALLDYLYTGKFSTPSTLIQQLLDTAKRLQLEDLQELCHPHITASPSLPVIKQEPIDTTESKQASNEDVQPQDLSAKGEYLIMLCIPFS